MNDPATENEPATATPPAGAAGDPTRVEPIEPLARQSPDDTDGVAERPEVYRPWRSSWRTFRKHRTAFLALIILVVLYVMAIFADFIAPYGYDNREPELQWSPPVVLHFSDANGFSFRPFIHPITFAKMKNLK